MQKNLQKFKVHRFHIYTRTHTHTLPCSTSHWILTVVLASLTFSLDVIIFNSFLLIILQIWHIQHIDYFIMHILVFVQHTGTCKGKGFSYSKTFRSSLGWSSNGLKKTHFSSSDNRTGDFGVNSDHLQLATLLHPLSSAVRVRCHVQTNTEMWLYIYSASARCRCQSSHIHIPCRPCHGPAPGTEMRRVYCRLPCIHLISSIWLSTQKTHNYM